MCSQTRLTLIIIALFTANMVENIILNNNTSADMQKIETNLFTLKTALQANSCFHLMLPSDDASDEHPKKFKKPKSY